MNSVNKEGESILDREDCMLTTIDNPWNPFTNFQDWYNHDTSFRIIPEIDPDVPVKTCTCEYLDRVAITSPNFSEEENHIEMVSAMNEIIDHDMFHIYKIVHPSDYK